MVDLEEPLTPKIDISRIAVIIPMRGGSVRLPGKHARSLAGLTLPERTALTLTKAGLGDQVWLTTDDPELAEIGSRLGWHVPMLRPADLATSDSPTMDAVIHVLDHMIDFDPDVVLLIQTTSPFCPPDAPTQALAMLARSPTANAVLAVHRLRLPTRHLYRSEPEFGLVPWQQSTDIETTAFAPTGAVYAVRTKALRRTHSLTPPPLLPLELDTVAATDIDTPEDWLLAECFANAGLEGRCVTAKSGRLDLAHSEP